MNKVEKNNISTLIINGIIALIFGLFALLVPQETMKATVFYFGILLILGGIIGIVVISGGFKTREMNPGLLLSSVLSLVIGLFMLFNVRRSLELIAIILGIWAISVAVFQFIIALRSSSKGFLRKLLYLNSLLSLFFGILLFFNPLESLAVFTVLLGILAIIWGGIMIYSSLMLLRHR